MNMNSLDIHCAQGQMRLEPFQSYMGIAGKSSDGPLNLKVENQQAVQMDQEALAILNGTLPVVPGTEGLKDIKIIEAIHKSATTGKVVTL